MKKVFVVGCQTSYARWIYDSTLVDNIEDADIVLFTGGEDVDPSLYGAKAHDSVWSNPTRDEFEVNTFKKIKTTQLAVGICRGLQLFNVLNGGTLVQDVNNHWISDTHEIHNELNRYEIKSLHHQMVYPFNLNPEHYKILYWTKRRSTHYYGEDIDADQFDIFGEPEVVYYCTPGLPKCLGIQGHPEMMRSDSAVVVMLNDLLNNLL